MNLSNPADVVGAAHGLLELRANWDGEGSERVDIAAWSQAVSFTLRVQGRLSGRTAKPRFGVGSEGSVDVHWRGERGELLINFPSRAKGAPKYYGDNTEGGKIYGLLSVTSATEIARWVGRFCTKTSN